MRIFNVTRPSAVLGGVCVSNGGDIVQLAADLIANLAFAIVIGWPLRGGFLPDRFWAAIWQSGH